ncbi:hypothetical protein [Jeotgalibacillus marinus]|uniref:DAC domain-containing protein n=1 Tax=Jeotgalibacillus marinus TaxID=86667 RepID=A0ABV3Q4I8_9BACL
MKVTKSKFSSEVKRYTEILERYLTEYTGYQIKLENQVNEKDGTVDVDVDVYSPIKYPYMEKFILNVLEQTVTFLDKSISLNGELDWELFEKVKSKLTSSFIFGQTEDGEKEYKRIQFLKDMVNIGHRTYEGFNTRIGVIYAPVQNINDIADKYDFKVIEFDNEMPILELFEGEKPLLRLVEGNVLNLIVNSSFKVYGFAITTKDNSSLSETIIQDFENARLLRSIQATKEDMASTYDYLIENEVYKEVDEELQVGLKYMLALMKETVEGASTEFEGTSPNIVYFKLSKAELNVYNAEDFIVSFSKGEWKLKNYHILQFVLMRYMLHGSKLYLLVEESLDKSKLLHNIVSGTNILINTLKKLSSTNTSSILMILPIKPEEIAYSTAITIEEAMESLSKAPLKKRNTEYLYLKIVQGNGVHLSVTDVGASFLSNLCSIDGALVLDDMLNILSYGEIIDTPSNPSEVFGTGTNACKIASENGSLAIKVSEDGDIKVYLNGEMILTI